MLICKVNNMKNFVFWAMMKSYREKISYDVYFSTQFSHFSKKEKLRLIRLLATTLSPLGLTPSNSMLALIAIKFFLLSHTSSYLMAL
jgi:hypothetical protein